MRLIFIILFVIDFALLFYQVYHEKDKATKNIIIGLLVRDIFLLVWLGGSC